MQGPEQRCLLRRRRASRPGFRPPPLQPPPGLPEPRPPQPHLRRLETRALGGAEEGGGRAEPGSTAASRPLSGAKPEREREKGGRAGEEGRGAGAQGLCAGAFRARGWRAAREKQPGRKRRARARRRGTLANPAASDAWRGPSTPRGYLARLCLLMGRESPGPRDWRDEEAEGRKR